MGQPIIEFKGVSKHFKKKTVLDNVNFAIEDDEIIGLVGRSGAGKTTLFRLFLGIYKPSSGEIFFQGKKITSKIKKDVGFASQENSFYLTLTVEENLRYFGMVYNLPSKEVKKRIGKLLKLMQLEGARKTKAMNLSGGMKRRLGLAIALIHDPSILILDEPTTGLDIIIGENIWNLIMKINKLGKTVIVSSHNLTEIEKYCTAIAFISKGQVTEWKELQKLKKKCRLSTLFKRYCNDPIV